MVRCTIYGAPHGATRKIGSAELGQQLVAMRPLKYFMQWSVFLLSLVIDGCSAVVPSAALLLVTGGCSAVCQAPTSAADDKYFETAPAFA